jgi:hypothetical protein
MEANMMTKIKFAVNMQIRNGITSEYKENSKGILKI